jgi:predicted O-methyltransferase YrrM
MKRIRFFKDPVLQLMEELDEFTPEMSQYESFMLSGLIKMKCPKKVVELGVAEGATTCVIMKTFELLNTMGNESFEVYSVDLNKNLYYDASKKTGYQYSIIKHVNPEL